MKKSHKLEDARLLARLSAAKCEHAVLALMDLFAPEQEATENNSSLGSEIVGSEIR